MNRWDGMPVRWQGPFHAALLAHRLMRDSSFIVGAPGMLARLLATMAGIARRGDRIGTAIAADGDTKHVAMLVVSTLSQDPRVERAARTAVEAGYRVTVVCPAWREGPLERLDWGPEIDFVITPRTEWSKRFPYLLDPSLFDAALALRPWAYHCHDLNTCVVGLAAAVETGARCICDFHEWFSENAVFDRRGGRLRPYGAQSRLLMKAAERLVMRHASAVITVSQSIAAAIEEAHAAPGRISVLRNIPLPPPADDAPPTDLRQLTGLSPEMFLLLYQGGLGPTRNLEPVIRALAGAPRAALVIRGPGGPAAFPVYEALARSLGVADRLVCLPPVPPSRVVVEATTADAGVWTLEDVCPNFRLALPNKVFEYLNAGLPLLVADLPEVRMVSEEAGVGLCFEPDSPESIAAAINRMIDEPEAHRAMRARIPALLETCRADQEWPKLLQIYQCL